MILWSEVFIPGLQQQQKSYLKYINNRSFIFGSQILDVYSSCTADTLFGVVTRWVSTVVTNGIKDK